MALILSYNIDRGLQPLINEILSIINAHEPTLRNIAQLSSQSALILASVNDDSDYGSDSEELEDHENVAKDDVGNNGKNFKIDPSKSALNRCPYQQCSEKHYANRSSLQRHFTSRTFWSRSF